MNEARILDWMRDKVHSYGFFDATSLAESFLQAHRVNDPLDPVFSLSLDAAFKVAQEIRDHELYATVA